MKAITIARISEKPKEKGNSLPAQTRRLRNYCERMGYKIIKHFSYDESAYKKNRKNFDEILDFVLS